MLRDVIRDILRHTNAKITVLITASVLTNLDHTPYTYLVHNISANDATKLALHQCWATSQIGFLVYTAKTIVPAYLGTIQSLNISDDDTSALLNLVHWTFYESKILSIIADASKLVITEADLDPMEKAHSIHQYIGHLHNPYLIALQ